MTPMSPMTPMTPPPPTPERPTLRRSRDQRVLFGVCGGIASYFNLDPTLVRVGFVLIGLLPPMGGMLLLAYIALAVIVPEEGAEEAAGRQQVKDNLSSLRSELWGFAETVRARITGEPQVTPPTPTTTTSTTSTTTEPSAETTTEPTPAKAA